MQRSALRIKLCLCSLNVEFNKLEGQYTSLYQYINICFKYTCIYIQKISPKFISTKQEVQYPQVGFYIYAASQSGSSKFHPPIICHFCAN